MDLEEPICMHTRLGDQVVSIGLLVKEWRKDEGKQRDVDHRSSG